MANSNAPLLVLHYSPADNSWYGWWADGEPATISAAAMNAAYLELFHAYQQQGSSAAAAGRQAYADVHSMSYWNARAGAQAAGIWSVWDGLGCAAAGVLLIMQFLR